VSAVDVIIVNYRSTAHTAACVAAVHAVATTDQTPVRVIVVNNADPPDELERAVNAAGSAVFIHNESNRGFGAACNMGAKQGRAAFILFLNPDAVLRPGYFRECLAFLNDAAHHTVGIVGPAIENADGGLARTSSALPEAWGLIARVFGASNAFLPAGRHLAAGPVGQVMGAVLMIRRPLFESLGGFDERFFLYYEDVDLCARAAAAGAQCCYLTSAHAMHIGRVSSSHDKGLTLALFLRSMLTYARIHFGGALEILLVVLTFGIELPLRLLRAVTGGAGISGAAALRAYRLVFLNLITGTDIITLAARDKR